MLKCPVPDENIGQSSSSSKISHLSFWSFWGSLEIVKYRQTEDGSQVVEVGDLDFTCGENLRRDVEMRSDTHRTVRRFCNIIISKSKNQIKSRFHSAQR